MTFQEDLLPRKVWWKGGNEFSFGQSVNALSSICLSNHTHNRETKTEGSSPCTEVESGITPEAEGPSEQ